MKSAIMYFLISGFALTNLRAQKSAPIPAGKPASAPLTTENLSPAKKILPLPSSLVGQPGYLGPKSAANLSSNLWGSISRARDLLSQVNPSAWKISAASRETYVATISQLEIQLNTLEHAREQFSAEPTSAANVFTLYAAIADALPSFGQAERLIRTVQDPTLSGELLRSSNELRAFEGPLEPYLLLLLHHRDAIVGQYESDVAHCQDALSAAEHPHRITRRVQGRRVGRPQTNR